MNEERTATRRGFLEILLAAGGAILAAALALPALAYLWPAARGGPRKNVLVEGAEALKVGGSVTVQVAGVAVIVVRHASGFRAFSAACTHLGCLVKWDAGKNAFLCPCHGGVFDAEGRVVAGPPPTPLPAYTIVTAGSKIYVAPKQGGAA
jgi:cytochrome b6-f complex iron-sulfur subunit